MKKDEQTGWKGRAALFLTSQIISLLGTSLVQYAMIWYVTLKTGSGTMMTVYIVAGFLPTFLLSPFAGVWADRYDRKKLIIISDSGIALVTLMAALIFIFIGENVWVLIAAAALRAVGSAVQGPAVGALLPQFVPKEKLMRVNGIFASMQSAVGLGSPVVSGILMAFTPLFFIFLIDVVTAVIAVCLLAFFLKLIVPEYKSAELEADDHKISYFSDMIDGFRYIGNHHYLVPFFVFIALVLFLISPAAFLTPLQASRTYGPDVWRLTGIEVFFSAGMLAGGGILAVWGGFRHRFRTMLLSVYIMALCTVALGFAPPFWVYLGIMGIFGIGFGFYNTPSMVLLQETVEDEFLGRVMSVSTMLFTSMMPLAMLLFGPLAETVSIELLLLITGGLMLFLSLISSFNRRLTHS